MRKLIVIVLVVAAAVGAYFFFGRSSGNAAQTTPGAGGAAGGRGGAFAAAPMTVSLEKASRARVTEHIQVVGNLIGAATVQVAPKFSGRLQSVDVKLGDRVRRGQTVAQIEASEIQQQVKQAEASFEVAQATIRQRDADLKLSETTVDRSRNLFGRQLLPRQTLDDAEARYQSSVAQLDLARAQFEQAKARLEELRINLSNTRITSPVDGFVGKRHLDQGSFVGQNSPVVDVVDIHIVRLVANLVEKDLRRITIGTASEVEVDAYPGEMFAGRVARLAPVLDPATRTAEIEVEIANADFRLKPGMYSRVKLVMGERLNALVIPRNALVDADGKQGVFIVDQSLKARFKPVEVGLQDENRAEILSGIGEGQAVVTTGSSALRDGVTVALPGQSGRPAGGQGGRERPQGRPQPGAQGVPRS